MLTRFDKNSDLVTPRTVYLPTQFLTRVGFSTKKHHRSTKNLLSRGHFYLCFFEEIQILYQQSIQIGIF